MTLGQVFGEAYRLRLMRGLEESLHDLGHVRIAGVDEAGRGCLAGPVVAAAVIVEPGCLVPGVDDSKRLSAAKRERLAEAIRAAHPHWALGVVEPEEIDRVNILQATRRAMARAITALPEAPDAVILDAMRPDTLLLEAPRPVVSWIRGDSLSYAVACASILAKTERDQRMVALASRHPVYGFAEHKGYGSVAHREALRRHGPCEAHRLTFKSVLPRRAAAGGG